MFVSHHGKFLYVHFKNCTLWLIRKLFVGGGFLCCCGFFFPQRKTLDERKLKYFQSISSIFKLSTTIKQTNKKLPLCHMRPRFQIPSEYSQEYRVHGQSTHPKTKHFSAMHKAPQNYPLTKLWECWLPGGPQPETKK